MESVPTTRCCPICSARLLPAETVCNKCSNNTKLPPRKTCPWCAEALPRGTVICRHCHADLAVPEPERVHCATCGAPVSATALACIRCGKLVAPATRDVAKTGQASGAAKADEQSEESSRAPHVEQSLLSERSEVGDTTTASQPRRWRQRGVLGAINLGPAAIGVGLLVLAAEGGLAAVLVLRGVLPLPSGWLDIRVTAWVIAHSVTCGAALLVGVAAAGFWRPPERRRVWSPGAIAFAAVAPSLALAWNAMHLVSGLWRRVAGERRDGSAPTTIEHAPTITSRLLSQPLPRSPVWTWLAAAEVAGAFAVCVGLMWPEPWVSALSPELRGVVASVRTASPWLVGVLAVLGIGHLLWAACGWTWETYEEGGLVTWLSPVVLLAPLLVFLSTSLLTGLGADIAGRRGISLAAALRDSLLLWGLMSLYGAYFLLMSWTAMRGFVTLAVIGYVLCGPMLLSGWQAGRRQTHRLECGLRLSTLAAGLRRYADTYGTLPPPVLSDDDGTPLHSWRVLVLPFIGQEELFARFDLTIPWDAPVNRVLLSHRPDLFACDELPWDDRESTLVSAVVGEPTFFPPSGGVPRSELDRQGADRLLLLEASHDQRHPWTAPTDVHLEKLDIERLVSIHSGPLQAVAADGTAVDLRPRRGPQDEMPPIEQRFWRPTAPVQ